MGLIREYSLASAMRYGGGGDPFSFRGIGRKFKKIGRGFASVGKGAFRLGKMGLRYGSSMIPGPLGTVAGLVAGDALDDEEFRRVYGFDAGDPGKAPKRKSAGAGPRHKARVKKAARAKKRGGFHVDLAKIGGAAARIGGKVIEALPGGGVIGQIGSELGIHAPDQDAGAGAAGELGGLVANLPGAGGAPVPHVMTARGPRPLRMTKRGTMTTRKKPAMQVTNVHAIRRSARRLEGFHKLSQRVHRELAKFAPRPRHQVAAKGKR